MSNPTWGFRYFFQKIELAVVQHADLGGFFHFVSGKNMPSWMGPHSAGVSQLKKTWLNYGFQFLP